MHHHTLQADGLYCKLSVPLTKPVNKPTTQDKWEIERSSIKSLKCLTTGEFGETWEGHWKRKISVMIKTNIATNIPQEGFLKEANILKKLRHDNIIRLHGVCTKEHPFYIVTELMENGNLKEYLKKPYASIYLIDFAVQVANGMIYLGEQDYIHCDLRAENILVKEKEMAGYHAYTLKISNFHFAQHLNSNKYCTTEGSTRLAVRWTAPEGITSSRLSIKSDVWSFGILLWELVTKGRVPYPGMTDEQVLDAVPQGYRMPEPEGCQEPFYQIMLKCWKLNDDRRTHFNDIHYQLFKIQHATHDILRF